jgi:hypothetical protein
MSKNNAPVHVAVGVPKNRTTRPEHFQGSPPTSINQPAAARRKAKRPTRQSLYHLIRLSNYYSVSDKTWFLDVCKRCKGDAVAERRWNLASYKVAGIAPNNCVCPEGTPEFRRPVRTVSFLQQAPGTSCRANFRSRSATAEMRLAFYPRQTSRNLKPYPTARARISVSSKTNSSTCAELKTPSRQALVAHAKSLTSLQRKGKQSNVSLQHQQHPLTPLLHHSTSRLTSSTTSAGRA